MRSSDCAHASGDPLSRRSRIIWVRFRNGRDRPAQCREGESFPSESKIRRLTCPFGLPGPPGQLATLLLLWLRTGEILRGQTHSYAEQRVANPQPEPEITGQNQPGELTVNTAESTPALRSPARTHGPQIANGRKNG